MSEPLHLTPNNLTISRPPSGVTVEYTPAWNPYQGGAAGEERGRLENVTLGILVAVDKVLRGSDPTARQHQATVDKTTQQLVAEGLVEEGPGRNFGSEIMDLGHLSTELTHGLLFPNKRLYDFTGLRMGCNIQQNVLGDTVVSRDYDYDSPFGIGAVDVAHWYKKTLQVVRTGRGQLHVGAYAYGNQFIKAEALEAVFNDVDFVENYKKDTGLRVAEEQAAVIPQLHLSLDKDQHSPSVPPSLALPGLHNFLQASGLTYEPFTVSEPSPYGAGARAKLMDTTTGLGLDLKITAGTSEYDKAKTFETDAGFSSFNFVYVDGSPLEASYLDFSVKPMATMHGHPYQKWSSEFRQDENILQTPERRRAAQAISTIVLGIHQTLTGAAQSI